MNAIKNKGLLGIVLGSLVTTSAYAAPKVQEVALEDSSGYKDPNTLKVEDLDKKRYLVLQGDVEIKSADHPEFDGKYSPDQLRVNVYDRDSSSKRKPSDPKEVHGLKFVGDKTNNTYRIELPEWAANGALTADLVTAPNVVPKDGKQIPKWKVGVLTEAIGFTPSEGAFDFGAASSPPVPSPLEPTPSPDSTPVPSSEVSGFDAALSLVGTQEGIDVRFADSKTRASGFSPLGTIALGYQSKDENAGYRVGGFFGRGVTPVTIKDLTNGSKFGGGKIRDQLRVGLVGGLDLNSGAGDELKLALDLGYLREGSGLKEGVGIIREKHQGLVFDASLGLPRSFVNEEDVQVGFHNDLSVEVVDITADNGDFVSKYNRKYRLVNASYIDLGVNLPDANKVTLSPGLEYDSAYTLGFRGELPSSAITRLNRVQRLGRPRINLTELTKENPSGLQVPLGFMVQPQNWPVYFAVNGLLPTGYGDLSRLGGGVAIGGDHWRFGVDYLRTEVGAEANGGQRVYEDALMGNLRVSLDSDGALLPRARQTQPNLR